MNDKRLAGHSFLPFVRAAGKIVGLFNQIDMAVPVDVFGVSQKFFNGK